MMVEQPQKIGPYEIVRRLGEGGMGVVYEGVHELIGRRVAIKVLHAEFAQQSEVVARFFNEARAVNRVAHPGLVQISDYGQLPDKSPYIVMEFLNGESLSKRIQSRAANLSLGQVLNFGYQLADSLAAAHGRDVIHRDLKPDNVMIVTDGQAPGGERTKLLDFGIAKLVDDSGQMPVRTRTDAVMGTPSYMSPEQCRGAGQVDSRSDVYSLGVMLYEMVCGERPIGGKGHGEILSNHLMVEPAPLVSKAPRIPSAVAALVHRMLIKNREQRPTMQEVALQLETLSAQTPPPAKRRTTANVAVVAAQPVPTLPPPSTVAPEAWQAAANGQPAGSPEVPDAMAGAERVAKPPKASGAVAQRRPVGGQTRRLALLGGVGSTAFVLGLLLYSALLTRSPSSKVPMVRLRIDSTPPGAEIVRVDDGQLLGMTPWTVLRPAEQGLLKVRLRLANHAEKELELDQSMDSTRVEPLEALLSAPKPAGSAAEQEVGSSTSSGSSGHRRTHSTKSGDTSSKKHHHKDQAAPKAGSPGGSQLVD